MPQIPSSLICCTFTYQSFMRNFILIPQKTFWVKVEIVQKRINYAKLCKLIPLYIIFRINNFWSSNNYRYSTFCPNFNFFRLLHQYWHKCEKRQKCRKTSVSKIGVLSLVYSQKQIFPRHDIFLNYWAYHVYEISETSNDWIQSYGQKTSKMPQKWRCSPICDPQIFFSKIGLLSLLYTNGALTLCKKLEKTNEPSLRYLKTDQQTTDRQKEKSQGQILRTPSGKPGVHN